MKKQRKQEEVFLRVMALRIYMIFCCSMRMEENQDQIVLGENERKKIQKTDETLRNVMIGQVEIEKVHIETSPGK